MNRFAWCPIPVFLLAGGCFSSTDTEDYKPLTSSRWREMIKEDQNRLKPEEQRPSEAYKNPLRLVLSGIGEIFSRIHDLATGHTYFAEARKLLDASPDHRRQGVIYLFDYTFGRHDPYAKRYMDMAQGDADFSVRAMALRALNRSRDRRAIPIFVVAVEEKNEAGGVDAGRGEVKAPGGVAME